MAEIDFEDPRNIARVVTYTSSWIITGDLRQSTPIRLSDLLNNWSETFIPLANPRIINLGNGAVEADPAMNTLLVSWAEILLLHELPTRESAVKGGAREMVVPKRPASIRAFVGPFRIQGSLYLPQHSDVIPYLNRGVGAFVPLTDVSITAPGHKHLGIVQIPFALVNQSRLLIGGVEEAPSAEEQTHQEPNSWQEP